MRRERILVVASSRLGSTAEVAAFVGRVLQEQGAEVDVRSFDEVGDLRAYGHVVVGSPIRYERWLPEARCFVTRNAERLRRRRVSLFFTCLAMAKGGPEGARTAAGYARDISALLPNVNAAELGRFAGVLSYAKAPLHTRLLLFVLSKVKRLAPGDYRNWHEIRRWTTALNLAAPLPTLASA